MTLEQVENFLNNEVKGQIELEIEPLLYPNQETGGYFGVTLQVLCFLEFLGAAYTGYNGTECYFNGAKKISTSEKTLKFIAEVLGSLHQEYSENGKFLYAMYRHGLVHLYQPRTIKLDGGKVLIWAAYKGERIGEVHLNSDNGSVKVEVSHLKIADDPRDGNFCLLPVSINCLHEDLLAAIDKYLELLKRDGDVLDKWQSVANAISEPEESSVVD